MPLTPSQEAYPGTALPSRPCGGSTGKKNGGRSHRWKYANRARRREERAPVRFQATAMQNLTAYDCTETTGKPITCCCCRLPATGPASGIRVRKSPPARPRSGPSARRGPPRSPRRWRGPEARNRGAKLQEYVQSCVTPFFRWIAMRIRWVNYTDVAVRKLDGGAEHDFCRSGNI